MKSGGRDLNKSKPSNASSIAMDMLNTAKLWRFALTGKRVQAAGGLREPLSTYNHCQGLRVRVYLFKP